MIDPQARLVAALKRAPGMMVDAIYRLPGAADQPCRVGLNASVQDREIGTLSIKAGVRFAYVHQSDIGTDEPKGKMYLVAEDKTYNIQVAADRDTAGWWKIGLVPLRERP